MAIETSILGHSYYHFEDLQLSSKEFYQSIEDTIKSYEYPNLAIARVNYNEGGILSSSREYLRIKRNDYLFYVCAAPFGRSFFISWRLKEEPHIMAELLGWIPFIGKSIVRSFQKKTAFQEDTGIIFKESIKSIIDAMIAEITQTKGLRSKTASQQIASVN
jgi:hypothetical protein